MLNAYTKEKTINIEYVLNTPEADEDIISVCDKLIVSLKEAENNAKEMTVMLNKMKNKYT
jgi:hypothetical protein